ncbi:hypothetical protein MTO96_033481 [Rhipicephalus appendiculatus]
MDWASRDVAHVMTQFLRSFALGFLAADWRTALPRSAAVSLAYLVETVVSVASAVEMVTSLQYSIETGSYYPLYQVADAKLALMNWGSLVVAQLITLFLRSFALGFLGTDSRMVCLRLAPEALVYSVATAVSAVELMVPLHYPDGRRKHYPVHWARVVQGLLSLQMSKIDS